MRLCSGGCRKVIPAGTGKCAECSRKQGKARRQNAVLTYAESWWRRFRVSFIEMLVQANVVPACGATMPGGPTINPSLCLQQGHITGWSSTGTSLHLHHEPELTELEAADRAIVCNPLRIVLLCDICHNRTTGERERHTAHAYA